MYSKEFRRPTPPKNYSGTAFRGTSPYIAPQNVSSDVPQDTPASPPLSPALLPPSAPASPHNESGAPTYEVSEVSEASEASVPEVSEVDDRGGGREENGDSTVSVGGDCPGCHGHHREPPPSAHRPPEHSLLGALIPPGLSGSSGSGLGFEELLLTGLILLLAQSDRDSDLVLMLALLLLYQ